VSTPPRFTKTELRRGARSSVPHGSPTEVSGAEEAMLLEPGADANHRGEPEGETAKATQLDSL
jgi:hypothetical protein